MARWTRLLIRLGLLAVMVLTACTTATATPPTPLPIATETPAPTATAVPPTATPAPSGPWWNRSVFYEILVRSFKDSNGDGIGDFNGITEQLDYLQALGVRGLWLMPINPSPSYHGYDVTDYYGVNPDYGTLDDFKRLLDEAHKRDIKIIVDMVFNHTSARHPWFQEALKGQSKYVDWYIWSDTDPGTTGPWGQKTWYRASNGKFYYAMFWDQMPDLNYNNPEVQTEIKKVTAFWLQDVGVDGFRLDAARYLIEDGKLQADTPQTHAFLKDWGAYYRSLNPQAFTVGEIWTSNGSVAKYTRGDELTSAFNFDLSARLLKGLSAGQATTINFVLASTLQLFPNQSNANFLTNHDMNRATASFLSQDPAGEARAAAAVILTAPGIPFLYYGEEIGMTGVKPDERLRSPMQWTGQPKSGFTTGTPWEMINNDYKTINVAAQTGQPDSLLEFYRRLIALRNAHPALSTGATAMVKPDSPQLVTYLRTSGSEIVLVIINVDDQPVNSYSLALAKGPLSGTYTVNSWLDPVSAVPPTVNDTGGFDAYTPVAEIPPYGVVMLQLSAP